MLDKEKRLEEERKKFVEPELVKCEEPLDVVTAGVEPFKYPD